MPISASLFPVYLVFSFPMTTTQFTQEILLPASPQQVYEAIVQPEQHAAFTGQPAVNTDRLDLDFLAFGTYLSGRNLELVPGRRIRQTWRAQMEPWPADHYSTVTYEFEPHAGGTLLRLTHEGVPTDMAESMAGGWHQWYWQPLEQYFAQRQPA